MSACCLLTCKAGWLAVDQAVVSPSTKQSYLSPRRQTVLLPSTLSDDPNQGSPQQRRSMIVPSAVFTPSKSNSQGRKSADVSPRKYSETSPRSKFATMSPSDTTSTLAQPTTSVRRLSMGASRSDGLKLAQPASPKTPSRPQKSIPTFAPGMRPIFLQLTIKAVQRTPSGRRKLLGGKGMERMPSSAALPSTFSNSSGATSEKVSGTIRI